MNAFSPTHFRAHFPALADAGVYLDSAATALKPQAVIDATQQLYRLSSGNVHRSQFANAQRLTARYEAARSSVAAFLNAANSDLHYLEPWHRRKHKHGGTELAASATESG